MKIPYRQLIRKGRALLFSPRGRDAVTFCIFLVISAVLWIVMALNEETQRDIRARIEITDVPDSVRLISYIPESINISVRATGNELFTYSVGKEAVIKIDYRYYCRNGHISLAGTEMRALARRVFGQNTQIQAMSPDTLSLWYTSRPPVRLPIRINTRITTLPNCALTHPVSSTVDSVLVYSINPLPDDFTIVPTAMLTLNDVAQSETRNVPLVTPAGTRAYPDSIPLTISVEPMISRSIKVPVKATNVPAGMKMIVIPAQITVNYTLPMSRYDDSRPDFEAVADFATLDKSFSTNRIKVDLTKAEGNFLEVYMSEDSVEYIIEQQ